MPVGYLDFTADIRSKEIQKLHKPQDFNAHTILLEFLGILIRKMLAV
jgi:hypothetical protein